MPWLHRAAVSSMTPRSPVQWFTWRMLAVPRLQYPLPLARPLLQLMQHLQQRLLQPLPLPSNPSLLDLSRPVWSAFLYPQ